MEMQKMHQAGKNEQRKIKHGLTELRPTIAMFPTNEKLEAARSVSVSSVVPGELVSRVKGREHGQHVSY